MLLLNMPGTLFSSPFKTSIYSKIIISSQKVARIHTLISIYPWNPLSFVLGSGDTERVPGSPWRMLSLTGALLFQGPPHPRWQLRAHTSPSAVCTFLRWAWGVPVCPGALHSQNTPSYTGPGLPSTQGSRPRPSVLGPALPSWALLNLPALCENCQSRREGGAG